jgi:ribonuclease P protein component
MASLKKNQSSEGNKFPKEERLKSKKLIEELFEKGSSYYLYPFRLFYKADVLPPEQPYPQILFSVSKRNFKKAVDRNRIKRQMREAYRLNKKSILSELEKGKIPPFIGVLYTSKEKIDYKILEEKLILILQRLKNI